MAEHSATSGRLFTAVTSSTRQLLQLLRCVSFAESVLVQVTEDGLRFAAEEMKVMSGEELILYCSAHLWHSGLVFIHRSLFSTYEYQPLTVPQEPESDREEVSFQVSLSSLLEVLQIFGSNEIKHRWSEREAGYGGIRSTMSRGGPAAVLGASSLGVVGLSRFSYNRPGDPLSIVLEEAGVRTMCELFTYEEDPQTDISLQKPVCFKIIMRADWLFDAIAELTPNAPERLTVSVSRTPPHFTLSSAGSLGSMSVEFTKDRDLLDVFQCDERFLNSYKFSLLRSAARAMSMASRVSIRGDEQGVLNMQFLMELEEGGSSYVDFRFLAFVSEETDDESEETDVAEERSRKEEANL